MSDKHIINTTVEYDNTVYICITLPYEVTYDKQSNKDHILLPDDNDSSRNVTPSDNNNYPTLTVNNKELVCELFNYDNKDSGIIKPFPYHTKSCGFKTDNAYQTLSFIYKTDKLNSDTLDIVLKKDVFFYQKEFSMSYYFTPIDKDIINELWNKHRIFEDMKDKGFSISFLEPLLYNALKNSNMPIPYAIQNIQKMSSFRSMNRR